MKHIFITLFLALLAVVQARADWSLSDDGVLTITSNYSYSSSSYPWYSSRDKIKHVVISSSVTSIGNSAFNGCTSLKNLTIEDGSETLSLGYNYHNSYTYDTGEGLFYGCPLESVYLGRNISYNSDSRYGYSPFYNKSGITELTIGEQVTSIGVYAFYGCNGLTSVVIPSSVTKINNYAFNNCSNIKNLTIEDGSETLSLGYNYYPTSGYTGNGLFSDCPLESVYLGRNISYDAIRDYGYSPFYNKSKITELTIGEQVTSIGAYAFYGCSGLTSVVIPSSVTSIGVCAFYQCSGLTSVNFNAEKCSFMGNSSSPVFSECSSLTEINIGDNVTTIPSCAFYGCSGLTSVVIPSSVTSIGDLAFYQCSGLTSVNFNAEKCSSMSSSVFSGCSSLTEINIGDNVTTIPSYAFYGCSGLTNVVIPSSVTEIGSSAFSGCSGLTSVVMPSSVTEIGSHAFSGCSGLTSVVIPSSVTEIGSSAFSGCSGLTSVNFNAEKCSSMGSSSSPVFSGCSSLTEINIGDNVTTIPSYAFYGCSGLTSVVISSSVTSIGDYAFSGCSGLTSVVIPSSVTEIGSSAFRDCSGLTSVVIPSSVTEIGSSAFYGCSGLTSVVIPSSVTAISWYAFYGCSGLTSVTIPSSVTSIGDYAFNDCTSLRNLTIEDGSETLSLGCNRYAYKATGKGLFYDCPLESVYLGRNISYNANRDHGYSPFYNKSGITELTIGAQVTSIGDYAFSGCSGLTSVVIPSSVTSIGQQAFYNVTKAFFLTNTKPSIGSYAFDNCKVYYTANNDSYGISGTHKVYSLLSSMFEVDGVKYIPTSMTQRTCDMVDVDYTAESVNSAIGPTVKYTNSTGRQYDFKVNNINCYAGYECNALSDLYLNITEAIEDFAFYYKNGNEKITKIKLGDKITSIGSSCFSGCSSLLDITIPKLITTINTSTFEGCSSMTSVTFNNAVTSIGSDAFKNCSKLASLTIPANVTSIAYGAFDGCTSIGDLTFEDSENAISLACEFVSGKNLYLGRNVTYSMSNASPFSGNNVLETVMTNMNVTSVPNYEFYNCKSLKDVYLSDAVTTIGTYAFSGDVALANFEVGISVESIGAEAFSDCTALLDFKSHSIIPAIVGTEALDDIDKLECTLHVPEGTEDAYMAADQWKEFWIEGDLWPRYKVMATVDSECAGMGTVKGSNGYDKNTMATLEAVPAENYIFVEWSDGNKQNPRTMTVTEAVNLTAKFAYRYYIKTQPTANNISVALSEAVPGVEYKWYVSESEGGAKDITNDLQSTGSYAWRKSGGVWTSGNKGVHSSSSTLSMDITAKAGDKLTFDYSVSSESGYDYLTIYLGNNQIGSSYSGNASGKFDYTFESDMNTTLKFVYSKDGSQNDGSDQATISNVIIGGEDVMLLDGETSSAVTASGLETEMYYYCEVIMPDGTILTSDQVQYTGTAGSTYTISIASSDNGMVLGAGTYVAGTTITIEAIAAVGYEFVRWSDGNSDNPRVITVDANMNLTAEYKEATSTGISDIILSPAKEGIYDIMGRKLSVPQRGINIINGKKVIVR